MSVGCAMRTMNQQLACSFRCARRTLLKCALTPFNFQLKLQKQKPGIDWRVNARKILTAILIIYLYDVQNRGSIAAPVPSR